MLMDGGSISVALEMLRQGDHSEVFVDACRRVSPCCHCEYVKDWEQG